ncbi:ABC transporter ATP-binding protein [Irregularibacter muris]|uniref:ABC transporter ATP-binding protein n=1 Tax=Irregularibacter muris TaxID=1796619 RepID=A0AAE3L429_9FIRM|nr:ABC transporter ATP-binding protein [Irregularibacter muris]MCR1899328.1 ABC transporter ATP-binding protein [Irregularibacter muris]
MKEENQLLQVKNFALNFKVENELVNVIDHISFSINKGEIVGLVGESGCGKSITSLSVMGLLPKTAVVSEGEILFKDEDLLKIPEGTMAKIRGSEIGMIFQEPMTSLNPVFTIGDQISEMLLLHSNRTKKEAMEATIEKLKLVSIPSPEKVIKQYPHELSGGMRQRVMIAMAMACNPKLLIADEPTTALDVTIQAQILDLIKELRDKSDASILLITHDLGVVAEMCDRVIVMYAGRVVEKADVYSLYDNPQHPYTVGLLQSLPALNDMRSRLHTIRGTVPPPKDFPEGCRFAPRCEKAKDRCYHENPNLVQIGEGHLVSCFSAESQGGVE